MLRAMAGGWIPWLAGKAGLTHDGQPPAPHDLWTAWSWEPLVLLALAATGWLYLKGVRVLWQQAGRGHGVTERQALAFVAGLLVVFAALVSPVDAAGEALFSGHMIQHMLLIYLAGPLLAFGAPPVSLAWAVPDRWRVRLSRWWRRQRTARSAARIVLHPYAVWVWHAVALWAWHAPSLYELAVDSPLFHALEHASFLGTALLFWWAVFYTLRRGAGLGSSVLYLFTMGMQSGLLGALITFSPKVWYVSHLETTRAWGLTPLEDQQLAGVIMWVPAGIIYLGVALYLLGAWLFQQEKKDREALLEHREQPLP